MSYQPARYANPVLEEMERLFGIDEQLKKVAAGDARPKAERKRG